jgi:protein-S-isoprenylcysteine O-methyltransferase Ste14
MGQIMVFFLGSLAIAGFSWRVFSNFRSAGFFRFLTIEALWALMIINAPWWFQDTFSVRHILSWLMLLGFLALTTSALYLLWAARRPSLKGPSKQAASDQSLRLVTTGPYRYVRHPLYTALMLLAWGTALQSGSWGSIFFSLLATGCLYYTSLLEEDENLERFGEDYAEYMTNTRMFVPGVF